MTPAALYLVAVICGLDLASGRWDRDCGPFEPAEPAVDARDCAAMAAWLNTSAPAGVRVIAWACVGPDQRRGAIAAAKPAGSP